MTAMKNNNRKIVFISIVLLLVAGLLCGCNKAGQTSVPADSSAADASAPQSDYYEIDLETAKELAVFPGLPETESFRYIDGYKRYMLNSPVLIQPENESLLRDSLEQYAWILITSQSNEVKVVFSDGQWEAAGYSYGITQLTKLGVLHHDELMSMLRDNGIDAAVAELYYFESPMYFVNAILIVSGGEEYVVPYSVRPDFTGLEDGKLYTRREFSLILAEHFDESSVEEEASGVIYYDQSSLIQNYISYLGGDYEKGEAKYYCRQAGMLTRSDLLPQMDLIEAENQGLLGEVPSMAETVRVQKIYAQDQHELVIQQFGEDAWDNVSYTIEELDPIDGKGGYRIKATGEQIDRARYDGIINLFWLKVAQEEGVELSDILLTEDEGSEALANKRVDIISKHIDEIPVELVPVSEEKTFDVKLAFNGRTSSEDGYEGFHFVIVGSDEKGWVIFQGLSWNEPVSEYPVNEI